MDIICKKSQLGLWGKLIEGIFEVHLPVRNLNRSIEFYKRHV